MRAFLILSALFAMVGVFVPRILFLYPALAAFLILIDSARRRTWAVRLNSTAAFVIGAMIGLGLLSALWAHDPAESWERALKILPILLPGLILFGWTPAESLPRRAALVPALITGAGLLLATELALDLPVYRWINDIPPDIEQNTSVINRGIVVTVLLTFATLPLLRRSHFFRKKPLIIIAAAATPLLVPLLLTQSQSAQLAALAGIFGLLIFPTHRLWAWRGLQALIVAFLLAAPFLSIATFDALPKNLKADGDIFESANIYERLEIWDFISRRALERPILGHGIEAARAMEDFDSREYFFKGTSVLHPHDFALQIWLEFGMTGTLMAAALIVLVLEKMRTNLNSTDARFALAVVMAWLAIAATAYGLWQSWWLGLTILAVVFIRLSTVREPVAALPDSADPESAGCAAGAPASQTAPRC